MAKNIVMDGIIALSLAGGTIVETTVQGGVVSVNTEATKASLLALVNKTPGHGEFLVQNMKSTDRPVADTAKYVCDVYKEADGSALIIASTLTKEYRSSYNGSVWTNWTRSDSIYPRYFDSTPHENWNMADLKAWVIANVEDYQNVLYHLEFASIKGVASLSPTGLANTEYYLEADKFSNGTVVAYATILANGTTAYPVGTRLRNTVTNIGGTPVASGWSVVTKPEGVTEGSSPVSVADRETLYATAVTYANGRDQFTVVFDSATITTATESPTGLTTDVYWAEVIKTASRSFMRVSTSTQVDGHYVNKIYYSRRLAENSWDNWFLISNTIGDVALVTEIGNAPTDAQVPTAQAVKESIDALDVAEVGGSAKVITTISETDGKISATATDLVTSISATATASGTKVASEKAVRNLIDGLDKTTVGSNKIVTDVTQTDGLITATADLTKVTTITESTATDTNIPTEKAVKAYINEKLSGAQVIDTSTWDLIYNGTAGSVGEVKTLISGKSLANYNLLFVNIGGIGGTASVYALEQGSNLSATGCDGVNFTSYGYALSRENNTQLKVSLINHWSSDTLIKVYGMKKESISLLDNIYPVGSIVFGSHPLIGTWQPFNFGGYVCSDTSLSANTIMGERLPNVRGKFAGMGVDSGAQVIDWTTGSFRQNDKARMGRVLGFDAGTGRDTFFSATTGTTDGESSSTGTDAYKDNPIHTGYKIEVKGKNVLAWIRTA